MRFSNEYSRETRPPSAKSPLQPVVTAPYIRLLNGVMRELALSAGLEAAMRLMNHFGGQKIYIPKGTRIRPDSPIWIIGEAAARKLMELRGGEEFSVPTGNTLRLAMRRQEIADHLAKNPKASKDKVAQEFGVCRRVVQRIRAEMRAVAIAQVERAAATHASMVTGRPGLPENLVRPAASSKGTASL